MEPLRPGDVLILQVCMFAASYITLQLLLLQKHEFNIFAQHQGICFTHAINGSESATYHELKDKK